MIYNFPRVVLAVIAAGMLMLAGCSEQTQSTSKASTTEVVALAPATLSAEIIHKNAIVIDTHADIEIPGKESRYAGADGLSKVAPAKMRAGGVDAVVMAVAVGPGPRDAEGYAQAREKADGRHPDGCETRQQHCFGATSG